MCATDNGASAGNSFDRERSLRRLHDDESGGALGGQVRRVVPARNGREGESDNGDCTNDGVHRDARHDASSRGASRFEIAVTPIRGHCGAITHPSQRG